VPVEVVDIHFAVPVTQGRHVQHAPPSTCQLRLPEGRIT
jgi:hypothetical protein